LTERAAAGYVSFYWGGAMVGRFIGSAALRNMSPGKVLGGAAMAAFALVCTTVAASGPVAMWSIIAVGLFNSVMFPTIFTLGIDQLGPLTGKGSGLLIMAIVGGAILSCKAPRRFHVNQLAFRCPPSAICTSSTTASAAASRTPRLENWRIGVLHSDML
jgi:hypothetical protein